MTVPPLVFKLSIGTFTKSLSADAAGKALAGTVPTHSPTP